MEQSRTKDAVAKRLAETHFHIEPEVTHIFRLLAPKSIELKKEEPVKLLEVNPHTPKQGIVPIYFGAHAPNKIFYPSIIVEIHPEELEAIQAGQLKLPNGWRMGIEYRRSVEAISA